MKKGKQDKFLLCGRNGPVGVKYFGNKNNYTSLLMLS